MRRQLVVLYLLVVHTLRTNHMVCDMTLILTLRRGNPLRLQARRLVTRNQLKSLRSKHPLARLRTLWTRWVDWVIMLRQQTLLPRQLRLQPRLRYPLIERGPNQAARALRAAAHIVPSMEV